ncbi:hypothetical protein QLQ12_38850 [Actinoplanes sp. NEAU-A12]|uniref:Uncharacterized protein n=1 Tax=Actinoplanes sandaracinus TaxID=3045177 RepID=A0ABT6WXU4_9ACTN|nr:hypothetical protein [Actinoplanes sandaracinus]MDI6104566.1 hypothetical protein [Actinoplanes sandaracinus]
MMNLHDGLARIAGPAAEPTPAQVAADMARGQKALRRRRLLQAGSGSAFAIAALAAAVAFATNGGAVPAGTAPLAQTTTAATASAAAAPGVKLVAYTGEQPKGYTVDKVPDGWEIQGVDEYVLTLAPKDAKDKNINSFEGKVVVMLQSVDDKNTPKGEKVDVAGNPGVLTKAEGQTTGWWLFVDQPSGPRMHVQVWDDLGWSKSDVVEFAKGVHVNKNAKPGRG